MIDILLEPFSQDFMLRALVMATLIGAVCSIFSCFLVLRGWSLMGDAVSHAILPGLALAYLAGLPILIGAFLSGLLCALGTGYIKDHSRIKEDAVMGILFSGMFALGLLLMGKIETDIHLLHVLFGNLLGISQNDMIQAGTIAIATSALMLIKRKDLMLYCFDPAHAKVIGLPVKALHFGMLIFLSLTIVASLKAVGVILVIAMLIAPGAIGFLLCKSFDRMMMTALTVSVLSCLIGTAASYYFDTSTAPLIVLIQAVFFIAALITNKIGGHVHV